MFRILYSPLLLLSETVCNIFKRKKAGMVASARVVKISCDRRPGTTQDDLTCVVTGTTCPGVRSQWAHLNKSCIDDNCPGWCRYEARSRTWECVPGPGQDGAGRHTTLTQPQQIPIMITSSRNDKLGHRSHQHIIAGESDVKVNWITPLICKSNYKAVNWERILETISN